MNNYRYSSKTAIIYKNKRIAYKELVSYSNNLSELITNSCGKENSLLGYFYRILQTMPWLFAVAYSDNVVVPFNVNMKKTELDRIIKYLDISVIITNELFYDRLVDLTEKKNINNMS